MIYNEEIIYKHIYNSKNNYFYVCTSKTKIYETVVVEQYEMSNHVDKSLLAKRKRKTGKTMATTILTTIGLILFRALL